MIKDFLHKFNKPVYKHILFWIGVFLFYTTSARERFETVESMIVTYFFHVSYQIIIAYTILYLIIPRYKKGKKLTELIISILLLFIITNFFYVSVRMGFLEKVYPSCYRIYFEKNGHLSYVERLLNFKDAFFHLPLFYLQPLFFLVALMFYEKQYKMSKISEQKKILELKALKHQLNPHFLFNTLNNLYALAIVKSDKTPEVIEKLSDILQYMLYEGDKKFVPVAKEIELIENYLTLEQVRYEDKVLVSFTNEITENVMIAPLLLLTFIENSFKHGVSQELNIATVKISLATDTDNILVTIFNTKPKGIIDHNEFHKNIGLTNVEQQLELLYQGSYELKIKNTKESYSVNLKLKKNV